MQSLSIHKGEYLPQLLKNETLASLFKNSVGLYPDKIALNFNDEIITYAELDKWSDAIADTLQINGVTNGQFVGVWLKRGLQLHAAIIGIVKAGAAYVPLDIEMPAERVLSVLNEVGAAAYLSDNDLLTSIQKIKLPRIDDQFSTTFSPLPTPDEIAYVIYTSGSTGKPKGIPITHRQICHFVRAEQTVLQITATDKVYQGFSVSFDMWCEETWISYFVGATIFVADGTTAKAIDELTDFLNKNEITILHAVPSLLGAMEPNATTLRLINAGGEACNNQVLEKWKTPERQFFNSYGPTETTVTATIAELFIGTKITIGKPLPNYNIAVVNEQIQVLLKGEKGELVITGPGVSNGYINRADLNKEKFITNPVDENILPGLSMYKTGDAAVMNEDGSIDFHGRLDDQIKLRGYRIELGEIENSLSSLQGITAAAVALKKDNFNNDQLIAYVVLKNTNAFDEQLYKTALSKILPTYMLPLAIVPIEKLPRQPSGKIDRKNLPDPPQLLAADTIGLPPLGDDATLSEKVIYCLQKTFPNRAINLTEDFFTDLGGHSLLAATFISILRREGGLAKVSLKDVYLNRPLQAAVDVWQIKEKEITTTYVPTFNKIPKWRYYSCWVAQTIALLCIFGLFATQIFIPYIGYYYVNVEHENIPYAIATALVLFCLIPPFFSLVIIGTKWVVIGKMKEGDYPLWGTYYFRWWFVKTMQQLLPSQFLNGTPIYPTFLRIMGADIANDAQLSSFVIGAVDLLTIGKDVTISSEVVLNNAYVEDGLLKLRKIVIEDHAYVGSSAIVAGGSTIKAWGELQDLSYLQQGKTINEKEIWTGSPAQFSSTKTQAQLHVPLIITTTRRRLYKTLFLLTLLIFPFAVLIPLLPVIFTLNIMDDNTSPYNFSYLWIVPFLSALYIGLFAVQTIIFTRLLQKDIKPGTHSLYSLFYVRKWLADQLISLALIILHPIFATVFISRFFRALGAEVGKNTEISTASSVTHPLLKIGSGSFVADAVTLGETDIRGQQLILEETIIGDNSFVGNSALIPQGYNLPNNMLIGVLSTPPHPEQLKINTAKDWFGSPAIAIPNRQSSGVYPDSLTFNPTKKTKFSRAFIEFIRIIFPESAIFCFSVLFIAYGHDMVVSDPLWKIMLLTPFYFIGIFGLPAFFITVILKWLLVGVYKPAQYPMWTKKVWLSEAVTSTYEALAVPFLLYFLKGTPWLPFFLRFFGLKVGKRVWMNTTDITEFDMVEIGKDTAMNEDCGPQTHLFEDRVMKVGKIKIGKRTSIGARSIVLYDTEIGDDVKMEPLSLVMKGEKIPNKTSWGGSPVKSI